MGITLLLVAYLLVRRYFRSRRVTLHPNGQIKLEMDGHVQGFAVADITRVTSSGDFSPGPRICIEFTDARSIPGLDPGDSVQVLHLLGKQLREQGRAHVIDAAARRHLT